MLDGVDVADGRLDMAFIVNPEPDERIRSSLNDRGRA